MSPGRSRWPCAPIFIPPVPAYRTKGGDIREHIGITVEDYDLCPRYLGRVVKNTADRPLPEMDAGIPAGGGDAAHQHRGHHQLRHAGDRPAHARLRSEGCAAAARSSSAAPGRGKPITTLDGRKHTLTNDMLVIADADAPSCLAGIMGGLDSEIKDDTRDLFLECAKFRRDSVRRTARTLGIRTEVLRPVWKRAWTSRGWSTPWSGPCSSSTSWTPAISWRVPSTAISRSAGGPVSTVPASRITALLGWICRKRWRHILNRPLPSDDAQGPYPFLPHPSFRDDVEGRADLAEEVMRVYGYDHIVSNPYAEGAVTRGKSCLCCGAPNTSRPRSWPRAHREITTYSFISAKALDLLALPGGGSPPPGNPAYQPLGEEYAVLRTQLITSMLTVLSTNKNRKNPGARPA